MKTITLMTLCAVMLCFTGCGKKKSVNGPEIIMELTVLVTDENGEPVPGVAFTTNHTTGTVITGSDGKALIENVPSTLIIITGKKQGFPDFSKYIEIEPDYTELVHFIIHSKLTVHFKDDFDRPVSGASITTVPVTQNLVTDENGIAILKNIPAQTYTFTITRPNLFPVTRRITLADSLLNDIEINITSEKPVVNIVEPLNNSVLSAYNVVLQGAGTDYEDGELPDSLLVWHSSIDGELGKGKSLTVEKLTLGNHSLKLTGFDSDMKEHTVYVNVSIMNYNPNSYFPLFENSSWEYRHPEPDFYLINSYNVMELWKIKNLTITGDDENRRISTVFYDRSIGSSVTHIKYEITDYLETGDDNVYVTRTTEEMSEWQKAKDEDHPFSIMKVNTTYSPRFVILNNVSNMQLNTTYENTVKVETEWYYTYYNTPSSYFHESDNLTTITEVGDIQYVQTDTGQLEAAKITITQGKKTKKWWLTCGLGIVRLDYDISGSEQTAVLADSNMLQYYRQNNLSKAAVKEVPYDTGSSSKIYRLSSNKDKAAMELRNILRGMLP